MRGAGRRPDRPGRFATASPGASPIVVNVVGGAERRAGGNPCAAPWLRSRDGKDRHGAAAGARQPIDTLAVAAPISRIRHEQVPSEARHLVSERCTTRRDATRAKRGPSLLTHALSPAKPRPTPSRACGNRHVDSTPHGPQRRPAAPSRPALRAWWRITKPLPGTHRTAAACSPTDPAVRSQRLRSVSGPLVRGQLSSAITTRRAGNEMACIGAHPASAGCFAGQLHRERDAARAVVSGAAMPLGRGDERLPFGHRRSGDARGRAHGGAVAQALSGPGPVLAQ